VQTRELLPYLPHPRPAAGLRNTFLTTKIASKGDNKTLTTLKVALDSGWGCVTLSRGGMLVCRRNAASWDPRRGFRRGCDDINCSRPSEEPPVYSPPCRSAFGLVHRVVIVCDRHADAGSGIMVPFEGGIQGPGTVPPPGEHISQWLMLPAGTSAPTPES
jgi:hypothetical protein